MCFTSSELVMIITALLPSSWALRACSEKVQLPSRTTTVDPLADTGDSGSEQSALKDPAVQSKKFFVCWNQTKKIRDNSRGQNKQQALLICMILLCIPNTGVGRQGGEGAEAPKNVVPHWKNGCWNGCFLLILSSTRRDKIVDSHEPTAVKYRWLCFHIHELVFLCGCPALLDYRMSKLIWLFCYSQTLYIT